MGGDRRERDREKERKREIEREREREREEWERGEGVINTSRCRQLSTNCTMSH